MEKTSFLQPLPSAATAISVTALIVAVAAAFQHARPGAASLAIGGCLIAIGIAVRLLTNATLQKNEAVATSGLYAICRHPMYVGTMLAAIGIAIALNDGAALAIPLLAALISLWRMRKEETFLLQRVSSYADYRSRVPALPTPASVASALAGGQLRAPLSLAQCFRNGEMLRLNLYVGMIAAAAYYLRLPAAVVGGIAVLLIGLAAFSFRRHPADAPRSRNDYVLPALLGAAIATLALIA